MKRLIFIIAGLLPVSITLGQSTEENKEIARNFYTDLWFTNHTSNYSKYVADTYIVHDIGDRKGVTESAIRQKEIADMFWENGEMNCKFDYQIAEGDLVATRWEVDFKPKTLFGKIFLGKNKIPIINVFRIKNGKIVEIWNHRHDIDTNQTIKYSAKGFLIGIIAGLIPFFIMILKKRKKNKKSISSI